MTDAGNLRDYGRRILELLDGARKALAFYPADHPLVADGFRHLEYVLSDLFLTTRREVTLSVVDQEFYLDGQPLKRESTSFRKLTHFLEEREATSIALTPAVTADEMRRLFACLSQSPEALREKGGTAAAVEALGIGSVRLGRAVAYATGGAERGPGELPEEVRQKLAAARAGYQTALDSMKSVFDMVTADQRVDYRTIRTTTEALLDSVVTNRHAWSHLLNVKHTDNYSFNHSVNVTTLSLLLGTRFGLRSDALSVLGEAALLHDLGKQKVPSQILQKEGALTDEEWTEMRSHPEKGAKILLGLRDVTEAAVMVAYEHHVRYDYKGYPHTRSRRRMHLFSHLVAVADIYDALTSDRGYRRALVPDMAMRIIVTQSGTAFHPVVVKHFLNLVGMYPVGTFVRLRGGAIGLVQYNQSRDLLRPVVLVVYDAEGKPVSPALRDLSEEPGDEPPVESCVDPATLGLDLARLGA